jgi:desampylase
MTVIISRALHDRLVTLAAATPDVEVCGLLFGTVGRISGVLPARNVARLPKTRFEIDPAALIAALKAERAGGRSVIGHYHSHPNGLADPSVQDAEMADPGGAIWLIIAGGKVSAWRTGQSGLHDRFVPALLLIQDSDSA